MVYSADHSDPTGGEERLNVRGAPTSGKDHSLAIFLAGGIGGICPDLVHVLGGGEALEQAVILGSSLMCLSLGIISGLAYARLARLGNRSTLK